MSSKQGRPKNRRSSLSSKQGGFLDSWFKWMALLFVILAILVFFVKVQQGWSMFMYLRSVGYALAFSICAGFVGALMELDQK